jgi:hypothetical protein
MVKSPTWQLARVYIYTLPFANLDMILGNACLQGGGGICVAFQILSIYTSKSDDIRNFCIGLFSLIPMFICSNVHCSTGTGLNSGFCQIGKKPKNLALVVFPLNSGVT